MDIKINRSVDKDGYFIYNTYEDFVLGVNYAITTRNYFASCNPEVAWHNLFNIIYGNYPNIIIDVKKNDYLNIELDKEDKDDFDVFDNNYKAPKSDYKINIKATEINIIELYKDRHILYRDEDRAIIVTPDFIALETYNDSLVFYSKSLELSEDVINAISTTEQHKNSLFKYVIKSSYGFDTDSLEVKHNDIDLSLLYNDDLPHKQILEFLNSKDAGLVVLHGEPGTGKSSYIRHLIEIFPDEKFMILDSSVFDHITDSTFIKLLMDNANSVVILEDCENMVSERIGNKNISTLLNLTDGIIGDSFNLKFICTFNTEIHNIDPALLRKGRLKMKYEFKKLCKDKIKAIAEKKNINLKELADMTLAVIMNYEINNGNETAKKNNIGFKSSK